MFVWYFLHTVLYQKRVRKMKIRREGLRRRIWARWDQTPLLGNGGNWGKWLGCLLSVWKRVELDRVLGLARHDIMNYCVPFFGLLGMPMLDSSPTELLLFCNPTVELPCPRSRLSLRAKLVLVPPCIGVEASPSSLSKLIVFVADGPATPASLSKAEDVLGGDLGL